MIDLTWYPFITLLRREIARFMKVMVQTVVTPFVSAALYLMIFGVSLGQRITFKEGLPYLAFLIPGLVMMGCLNNAFQNTSSSIITSKIGGDLEDLKASPVSRYQIMLAMALAGVVRGIMVALITAIAGELAHYLVFGEFLAVANVGVLVFFLIAGGLCFANIGISVGFWAKSFDQLSAVGGFILLPLIYLGGVFFSIEHLPGFWQKAASLNPLLYMINGVRYGILGRADVDLGLAFTVTLATLLVTSWLALLSLRRGSFQRW